MLKNASEEYNNFPSWGDMRLISGVKPIDWDEAMNGF